MSPEPTLVSPSVVTCSASNRAWTPKRLAAVHPRLRRGRETRHLPLLSGLRRDRLLQGQRSGM